MVDLTEKSRENQTLYRGDSTEVQKYILGKADTEALVGRGIYLTTSYEVAKDYTIKGTKDGVVFKSDPGVDPKKFLMRQFYQKSFAKPEKALLDAFLEVINEEAYRFDQLAQHEIATVVGTGKESVQHPRYQELSHWLNMARSYATAYLWKISEPVLTKHLRTVFDQSYIEFKSSLSNTRMLMTVLKELVVLRDDQIGHVTRFRVPKTYLARTYRVDDPMPGWLITWIARYAHEVTGHDIASKQVDLRYNDPTRGETHAKNLPDWLDMFKQHGMRFAWGDHNVGGEGENPSLLEFILGTHYGGMLQHNTVKENQKPFWDALVDFLISRGYTGFHYQGGRRTGQSTFTGGSPVKHDAYSLWIERDIQGFRISSKPLGLKGTDPAMFQRFRFDTITAPIRNHFEYHTRSLKLRDEIANVDKIEEASNIWLESNTLDQLLTQALQK